MIYDKDEYLAGHEPESEISVTAEVKMPRGVVVDRVAEKLLQRAGVTKDDIEQLVEKRLDDIFAELTKERTTAIIDRVLADGWQTFDEYGRATGERKTIASQALDVLNAKDSYSRDTALERLIKQSVETAYRKEFAPIVEDMKKQFRAQVDDLLQAKFAETLRSSLGLK